MDQEIFSEIKKNIESLRDSVFTEFHFERIIFDFYFLQNELYNEDLIRSNERFQKELKYRYRNIVYFYTNLRAEINAQSLDDLEILIQSLKDEANELYGRKVREKAGSPRPYNRIKYDRVQADRKFVIKRKLQILPSFSFFSGKEELFLEFLKTQKGFW